MVLIFIILVTSEVLWNTKKLKGELGRKFVHITVGTFIAFWPFYMSFHTIQIISVALFVVVLGSRYLKIFQAVHTVSRKTWGDIMFAVGVGLAAIFTKSDWIFVAAVLHLSLADGLAAIVGKRYGKGSGYKVLGYTKSVVGTATFWLTSLLILVFVRQAGGITIAVSTFVWLPIACAAVENAGIYGLDNILVPLLVTLALRLV